MKASQRRMVTAAVAILIVIVAGLVIRNCGTPQKPITIGSGQSKTMGSVNWSVVSVLKVQSIEPSGANLKANGWFVIVDLYLKNVGKNKIDFPTDSLELADGQGKTYTPNEKATAAQVKAQAGTGTASIFNASISPNESKRLICVFEIGQAATKLQLDVAGNRFGSSKNMVINLGF